MSATVFYSDIKMEDGIILNQSNITTDVVSEMGEDMELPWYGHAICITTMLFIWVVGSVGNFLVIYVVCREKQLQTSMNMFLVNLSVADFITSAFGAPFPLIASVHHKWPFGEKMCIVYAFGMSLGGITSITTLMVLAFERYLMIARPFRAADILIYHSSAIILFIWIYSLALTLPPLFGWASYGPEGPYISCSVSWEKDDLPTKTYITFLFILGLVIPLITITVSYVGIVTTIRSTAQACSRTASGKAELRVTLMVGVMIACFLTAWTPYAVVSLIISFGGPRERELITPFVSVLPAIFAKSATCYNPVIYVGLNTQFQHAWMKLFGIQRENMDQVTKLTGSVGASAEPSIKNVKNLELGATQESCSVSDIEVNPPLIHPNINSVSENVTICTPNFPDVHDVNIVAVDERNVNSNSKDLHEFELIPLNHLNQNEEPHCERSSPEIHGSKGGVDSSIAVEVHVEHH